MTNENTTGLGDDLLELGSPNQMVCLPNYSVPAGETITESDLILVKGKAWNSPEVCQPEDKPDFYVLIHNRANHRQTCYWGELAKVGEEMHNFEDQPDPMTIQQIKEKGVWLIPSSALRGPMDIFIARNILETLKTYHLL
jgi:hypothetical protein